jgi:hypothetical protein
MGKLTSPNMWEAFDNSIARLPIRRIDFGDPADRDRHDRIVRLVEGLEGARKASREGAAVADRTLATRRAEGLNDELDAIVFELYGINDPDDRRDIHSFGAPL